jgi:hypothetical protein
MLREANFIRQGNYEKPKHHTMFCFLALAVTDTLAGRLKIDLLATLFEIKDNLK